MDLKTLISSDSDSKLRCFVCKNYLSYFPITVCSKNRSFCGRCSIPEGIATFKNEAFEVVAESFRFPCRYKFEGCYEELIQKDVSQHEQNCAFRVVSCIIHKPVRCKWRGPLPTLSQHCRRRHRDVIVKEDWFFIDLSVLKESDYLLEHKNVLFIFKMRFDSDSKILYCTCHSNKYEVNVINCSIVLSLKNGKRTVSLELETTKFEEISISELCLQSLINRCKNQEIVLARLSIGNKELDNAKCIKEFEDDNLQMALNFKCSKCSELTFLVTRDVPDLNIFCTQCNGDYISSWPKSVTVTGSIGDVMLTRIAAFLNYPCKYKIKGCTFVSKYLQIYNHQFKCEYQQVNCLLNAVGMCPWKGMKKDMVHHILTNHQGLFATLSDNELELTSKHKKCNFLKIFTYLFWLVYYVDENSRCVWSVQQIGFYKEHFKYEIDVIDGRNSKRRLLMRQNCTEWITKEDISEEFSSCCYLEKQQVTRFAKCQNQDELSVRFNVRIFK